MVLNVQFIGMIKLDLFKKKQKQISVSVPLFHNALTHNLSVTKRQLDGKIKYDYFEMKIVQPKGHIIALSRFKAKKGYNYKNKSRLKWINSVTHLLVLVLSISSSLGIVYDQLTAVKLHHRHLVDKRLKQMPLVTAFHRKTVSKTHHFSTLYDIFIGLGCCIKIGDRRVLKGS